MEADYPENGGLIPRLITGSVDLRPALAAEDQGVALDAAIRDALRQKPERHSFRVSDTSLSGGIERHMSVLGG